MQSGTPFKDFPDSDADWTEDHWHSLLATLVNQRVTTWHEVTALTLGHLNPSQVGTSIASKKTFQSHFPPRQTWLNVRKWHFDQNGKCADCGTRLELQADHMIPKEIVGEIGAAVRQQHPTVVDADMVTIRTAIERSLTVALLGPDEQHSLPEALTAGIVANLVTALENGIVEKNALAEVADRLDNMILRCRRCNVIRRPSHVNGGQTFLTAEAALMWILLVKRPSSYGQFQDLCRSYGMKMANIRFEEAWAMAIWLARNSEYHIDPSSKYGHDIREDSLPFE